LSSSLEIPSPSFGEAIKFLRKLTGLKQEEVSAISELHVTHISELENGRSNPTLETLEGLAKALDVPAAYLLMLEDVFERRRQRKEKT
jgi:transcriptional regulator with XRE-family HTH domain